MFSWILLTLWTGIWHPHHKSSSRSSETTSFSHIPLCLSKPLIRKRGSNSQWAYTGLFLLKFDIQKECSVSSSCLALRHATCYHRSYFRSADIFCTTTFSRLCHEIQQPVSFSPNYYLCTFFYFLSCHFLGIHFLSSTCAKPTPSCLFLRGHRRSRLPPQPQVNCWAISQGRNKGRIRNVAWGSWRSVLFSHFCHFWKKNIWFINIRPCPRSCKLCHALYRGPLAYVWSFPAACPRLAEDFWLFVFQLPHFPFSGYIFLSRLPSGSQSRHVLSPTPLSKTTETSLEKGPDYKSEKYTPSPPPLFFPPFEAVTKGREQSPQIWPEVHWNLCFPPRRHQGRSNCCHFWTSWLWVDPLVLILSALGTASPCSEWKL